MLLNGCSVTQQDNPIQQNEEKSYVPYVIIDGDIYYSYELNDEYTKEEVLAEVIKKVVPSDTIVKEDLTSNYYNEGTLIYTVKEDNEVLIIEKETGDEILKRYE
ncbi:hypothetical protein IQ10_01124 [Halalkalibacter nanhaiisediminis]|uniref:Uncharacterized protein n=1 Tax=Halalkalibacter nanhaiisediminis TaxID=688079 RepID=A0A562QP07_9BACI|nr:hypothetical protein IQ10_01124 [Halalkalibacter nanhaiisediminis]